MFIFVFVVALFFAFMYFFNTLYREMENAVGHVKFQDHYGRVHVQLSGSCKTWRSDVMSEEGGWLSTDVFVDTMEQKWHANLKVVNLFVPVRFVLMQLYALETNFKGFLDFGPYF